MRIDIVVLITPYPIKSIPAVECQVPRAEILPHYVPLPTLHVFEVDVIWQGCCDCWHAILIDCYGFGAYWLGGVFDPGFGWLVIFGDLFAHEFAFLQPGPDSIRNYISCHLQKLLVCRNICPLNWPGENWGLRASAWDIVRRSLQRLIADRVRVDGGHGQDNGLWSRVSWNGGVAVGQNCGYRR